MGLLFGDVHNHTHAPAYPQEVTIHQPAPPDMLRLVHEIEEHVLSRTTFHALTGDFLTGRVLIYKDAARSLAVARIALKINGVEIPCDLVEEHRMPMGEKEQEELRDKIALAIGRAALRGMELDVNQEVFRD